MSAVKTVRTTALLAIAALAAFAGAAMAQTGPSCTITGPEVSCGPAELCGPEGDYEYYWARPFGGLEYTRCMTAYESGDYILWVTDRKTGLQGEPCFHKIEIGTGASCEIKGPAEICDGDKAELCGPEGAAEYAWSGPDGFTGSTACVTVTRAGTYTLRVTSADTKCSSTCTFELGSKKCEINCPRTVGFWGAQCAQKKNGSTKFSKAQVTSIASCVDDRSAFFSWADDFAGFCATISTADMSQRVQAKRQYAGVLANICTGELGLIASNGNQIRLSTATVVSCGGETRSIGELIADVDAKLAALEGQDLALESVKSAYSRIIKCMDDINNGRGIGSVCPELVSSLTTTTTMESPSGVIEAAAPLQLGVLRAYPNPFVGTTRLSYAVAPQGEYVSLGVYDLAGRQVQKLFDGFQVGGIHESVWNATDANGARVRTGMYFVRGKVGERTVASRVMFVN